VSFYVNDKKDAERVLKKVSLVLFAESLGGVESLITYPLAQTHNAIPEAMRLAAGVNDKLLRLSVGIENPADIIADLEQALG
jgi:cystathionine gamma-synthase